MTYSKAECFFFGYWDCLEQGVLHLFLHIYMKDILHCTGIIDYHPISTTIIPSIGKQDSNVESFYETTKYLGMVGALQYLIVTRLDMSYAINHICQSMYTLTIDSWLVLKYALHYIKGTLDMVLCFQSSPTIEIHALSYLDWIGDPTDWKLTSGFSARTWFLELSINKR